MNKEEALEVAIEEFDRNKYIKVGDKFYTKDDVYNTMIEEEEFGVKIILESLSLGQEKVTEYLSIYSESAKIKLLTYVIDKWFEDGCPDGSEDTLGE